MKKALYLWVAIVSIIFVSFIVLASTSSKAHAEDDVRACPVPTPIVNTVYVDKIVTQVVTKEVPVTKTVKVEVPVYENNPVTSDPKIIHAMMKTVHDRYLALLAKYRTLKPRR